MATPTVNNRSNSKITTASTSVSVAMTAFTKGDLLVLVISADGNPTITCDDDTWTKADQTSQSTNVTSALFWKIATTTNASPPSVTFTLSASRKAAWVRYTFTASAGMQCFVDYSVTTGTASNANPTSLFPSAGMRDYLWIVAKANDNVAGTTAGPSGYSNFNSVDPAAADEVGSSRADKAASASSEDPGAFTSATANWVCYTLAVGESPSPYGSFFALF